MDLQAFRHLILAYWVDGPNHHQPNTRQYQQLRINAAARKIARANGERHLPSSYRLVPNDVYRTRFLSAPLPIGASIWYHSFDGSWWLGKIKQSSNVHGRYVIRFLDNPGPALIDLPESAYNRRSTPLVALGASKHTAALTRSKASSMVKHLVLSALLTPMSTPKPRTSKIKIPTSPPTFSTSQTKVIISTTKSSTPGTTTQAPLMILYLQ